MVHVTYKVVRHEDGWAYTVNGVFSESFPTHEEAREAARRAAAEQRQPGQSETIEYGMSTANGIPSLRSAAIGRKPTSRMTLRRLRLAQARRRRCVLTPSSLSRYQRGR